MGESVIEERNVPGVKRVVILKFPEKCCGSGAEVTSILGDDSFPRSFFL